jgi:hypothetical protein
MNSWDITSPAGKGNKQEIHAFLGERELKDGSINTKLPDYKNGQLKVTIDLHQRSSMKTRTT